MMAAMQMTKSEPLGLIHGLAAALALGLAWYLSGTSLVQTAVQFVAPAGLILAVHLGWLAWSGRLQPGFSNRVFLRSLVNATGLALLMLLGSLTLPTPAEANGSEIAGTVFTVLFCVVVLLVAGSVIFAAAYLLFALVRAAMGIGGGPDDTDSRLFDFGAVGVTALLMLVTGLEGLPQTYSFPKADQARAEVTVAADALHLWQVMETATAPVVPLPAILGAFPKPVDVTIDEGTALGANRVVAFSGREGAGKLSLEVTERSETLARFTVKADTSPYAQWISFRHVTYSVRPSDTGAVLEVTIGFERDLAPAWFFGPAMRGAAYFAARVLAQDVKARAEG